MTSERDALRTYKTFIIALYCTQNLTFLSHRSLKMSKMTRRRLFLFTVLGVPKNHGQTPARANQPASRTERVNTL